MDADAEAASTFERSRNMFDYGTPKWLFVNEIADSSRHIPYPGEDILLMLLCSVQLWAISFGYPAP